jgi:DNA invertase Pin-like site-specific DNA recombinase
LNGGDWQLLASYRETESGKNNDRVELTKAIDHCKATGATLVIAKLDRLSRDAHFLLGLQKSSVNFVCCDMPQADRLSIGIMAMIAQKEREMLSARTKAALAIVKEKGSKSGRAIGALGHTVRKDFSSESGDIARAKSIEVRSNRAIEHARRLTPHIKGQLAQKLNWRSIIAYMNTANFETANGAKGEWNINKIKRVIELAKENGFA